MKRKSEILLLLVSCFVGITLLEGFFTVLQRTDRTYPAVLYHTDQSDVKLMCYDDEFRSSADWDLRRENPFKWLDYGMNTDADPTLEGVAPLKVPHAVEMKLNEAGFRERSLAQLTASDAEITMILGDSFGAGQGVRQSDRLSEVLERRLNGDLSSGRHIVANFCKLGYNIKSVSETLERHLGSFPRVERVIYLFVLNDATRDARGQEMGQSIDDFIHLRTNLLVASAGGTLFDRSAAVTWTRERLARKRLGERTIEWYNYMYTNNPGWRSTKTTLGRMQRRCQKAGSEFIIVLFPLFIELSDYPLRSAHGALAEFSTSAGIPFLDLLELFEGRDERTYWVHPRDFHPNHRAHREVADYLYERIDW